MSLNHTDIALTSENFAIYRNKGYWISPVFFDDEELGEGCVSTDWLAAWNEALALR